MHISTRSGQIASDQLAATTFALDIAQVVEDTIGTTVGVWQGLLGLPLGTITWSQQVEGLAQSANIQTKLMENAEYVSMVQQAGAQGLFLPGSFQDRLGQVIHTTGDPGPFEYVSSMSATALPGQMGAAIQFAVEIADHVSSLTGNQLTVISEGFGTPGSITWFAGYAGADSVDAAGDAIAADPSYHERVASGSQAFLAGSSQSTLARRLR